MKSTDIGRKSKDTELNLMPLIDMVFILLIFFLVTTSFVKESGLEVQRPIASTAETAEKTTMIVAVGEDGDVWIDNKVVDIRSVRSTMERYRHENPLGNVVITADKNSLFGRAIEVLDEVRLAGIKERVVVAATKE